MINQAADADHADKNQPITQQLILLLQAGKAWFINSFDMILLDGQLAGLSLIRMLVFGLVAAVLLITSWILLLISLGFFFGNLGWSAPIIFLSMSGLTLVCALILLLRTTALSTNLGFKATRQQLSRSNAKTTETAVEKPVDQTIEVNT